MARIEVKSEITGTVWQLKAKPGDIDHIEEVFAVFVVGMTGFVERHFSADKRPGENRGHEGEGRASRAGRGEQNLGGVRVGGGLALRVDGGVFM